MSHFWEKYKIWFCLTASRKACWLLETIIVSIVSSMWVIYVRCMYTANSVHVQFLIDRISLCHCKFSFYFIFICYAIYCFVFKFAYMFLFGYDQLFILVVTQFFISSLFLSEEFIQDVQRGTFGKPGWFDMVKAEYWACREAVCVMEMSPFTKFEIEVS